MLSFVLAAALAVGVETTAEPEAPFVPRAAVFLYPSSSVAMLGMGLATNGGSVVYGAAGTSVRLNEKVSLDVELAGGLLNTRFGGTPGWIFSAGFGPSLQLTGDETYRGLFVSMRFALHAFRPARENILFDANHGPIDLGPGIARAFMGEIDLGYHLRFGRLYFAPIIGVGVGYAYDDVDHTGVDFWHPFTDASSTGNRPQHVVWSLNLNLARLGFAL